MLQPRTSAGSYPARIINDHLKILPCGPGGTLLAAGLAARSRDARQILAAAAGVHTDDGNVVDAVSARLASRRSAHGVDPWAVCDLARLMALQELESTDPRDALVLLDAALDGLGPARIAPEHQGFHAQLALRLGHAARARDLLRVYRRIPDGIRAAVSLDLDNPFERHADTNRWLNGFQALLPPARWWLAENTAAGNGAAADAPALDRLRAGAHRAVPGSCRITTIVTTFRPDEALLTAVRSLAAQSWIDHEVIIVDDGSPADHDDVLRRAAGLDPRVRLLRLPCNSGTYRARNAGLDAATGALVTFQDSDDWSHPERLARQAQPLLDENALFCTTSVGMRVSENLVVTRPGWADHRSYNISSMMFRREAALEQLGYLDIVRKGGDAEYVDRARAVFGRPAVRHLTGPPLALIRLSAGSLSAADIRSGWIHPARRAYLSAFTAWHRGIAAGQCDPRRPRFPRDRPFAAPRHLGSAVAVARPSCDVVLAGDWTAMDPTTAAALGRIKALSRRNLRVGVLHLDVLRNLGRARLHLDPAVQDLINGGRVEQVMLSDDIAPALLIVDSPTSLLFPSCMESRVRPLRLLIHTGHAPADRTGPAYDPGICETTAQDVFGTRPQWCPQTPLVRAGLAAHPHRLTLSPVDLPATIDVDQWRLPVRASVRSTRPVVGQSVAGDIARSPADRQRLRALFAGSRLADVRLLTAPPGTPTADDPALPGNWLVFTPDDVNMRGFLHQLDFYVAFPPTAGGPTIASLQAMAAGCVVLLPPPVRGDLRRRRGLLRGRRCVADRPPLPQGAQPVPGAEPTRRAVRPRTRRP